MFTIFIPVYGFLFLPILSALLGDPANFLDRSTKIQWALMLSLIHIFHGGLIGVIISMIWTSYSQKRSFWQTADFVAPLIPFGLGMGRIGNFINLELWGRETDVPWAMIFPNDPLLLPRHPSQLYEAFLEGFVLFIILNVFIKKPRPAGSVAGLFLVGYGIGKDLM